jgi:hypothetical protein
MFNEPDLQRKSRQYRKALLRLIKACGAGKRRGMRWVATPGRNPCNVHIPGSVASQISISQTSKKLTINP